MLRLALLSFIGSISFFIAGAQDYSNRGLMDIKERSEALRMDWIKAFEAATQTKNFTSLAGIRQENEDFLERQISAIRRLYSEGDARALLTAVSNYLQIEKQFVKDVMLPAESIGANDQDEIEKVNQRIEDFGSKEKIFLVEINNALLIEGEKAGPAGASQSDLEMDEQDEFQEPHGSVVEGRHQRRTGKLPHEMEQEKHRHKKRKRSAEVEEGN